MEDFGFVHSSSEDFTSKKEKILEMIVPFLEKLMGDDTTDTIVWPGKDRHKQIKSFIKKLKET